MFTKLINSAATNNAQIVRQNGTKVITVNAFNAGVAAAYLKLYNKAALPVPGTDIPVHVIAIPVASNSLPIDLTEKTAMQFPLGLGLAIVAGAADTDNTAVAAAQVKVVITYGG